MTIVPLRHVADVWTSSVDKHTVEGESPVQLCNYTDAYKKDRVRPGPGLMRATATTDEIRKNRLRIGDSVFTKDSEDPNDIGISAFVDGEADDFVCGYHLAVARPHANTHPRYLNWSLRGRPALDHFSVHAAGISRYGIGQSDLRSAPIWIVEEDQQRRIADFLDDRVLRIDRIIAARRDQLRLVEEAFLRSRWEAVVSDNWPDRRLSQMARMGTGHTPSKSKSEYWLNCQTPWLTTADVHRFRQDEIDRIAGTEFEISELGLANSAAVLHPKNTVALSRTASAGFSIIMDVDMATSQDFVTWTCGSELEPEFLLQVLRARRPYLLDYLSMGSTHKTIYFPDLMDLRISAPPVEVQRKAIGAVREFAASRLHARTDMAQQIDLLTEYKSSLITAAVTGDLDVTTAGSTIPG